MNEESLLTTTKSIHLFVLTSLVIINTIVLAVIVPIFTYYVMPDNQAFASVWEIVSLMMEGCVVIIIMSGIVYGTVKVIKKLEAVKNE